MATYQGMSLNGEVRESISLDEDDLSDVEDEVFIRDGKNSYKLAEELNVKRPLMAPRRKLGKPDLTSRLKAKPPCRAFCKPCCYIFAALSILIGIIVTVVILVSIFPLPLDRFRDWLISRSRPVKDPVKLLPCSNLKVTDVWSTNLPILTTDSPIRLLDLDKDGVDDIVFGFGTGDNYDILPPHLFCSIFLGVRPPCEGGVIALNGSTGEIVWRYWTNDTIFALQCSVDVNGDGVEDCLAVGAEGTLLLVDSRNGSVIWRRTNTPNDIFVPTFIPDQNNDSVADILSSHTTLDPRHRGGHLLLISGKTGAELRRITLPYHSTFFMPQLIFLNDSLNVLFGTGSPNSPGNLSISSLNSLVTGNMTIRTIYEDRFKGMLTQSILVDITGDNITDLVTSMYNSTVVAINGLTLEQIWNYTIPNSESNISPTPGYFNDDNVTDFLITYETYDNILNYNYTKTFIIDGRSGKPVYSKSIGGSVATQMNGLTLGMESHGFDMFLFWTEESGQFNKSAVVKLNALNQYNQPPGFEIYNSINRTVLEFNGRKSAMRQIKDYFAQHPKMAPINSEGQSEVDEQYGDDSQKINIYKHGSSSFRHKDNKQGIVEEYLNNNNNAEMNENLNMKFGSEETLPQASILNELPGDEDYDAMYNREPPLYDNVARESRSKEDFPKMKKKSQSKKKNLSGSKYGIYDYPNIKMSRNRLLHDLNNVPFDILRDTYFKNRENQLRKSKFEQRDLASHIDKIKQNEEVKNMIEDEKEASRNISYNLWDLESEKELLDKENGYWRGKREANYTVSAVRKVTSVGAIVNASSDSNVSSVDVVFVTYWQPPKLSNQDVFDQEIEDCLKEKFAKDKAHAYTKNTAKEQQELYVNECRSEQEHLKSHFASFSQIFQLSLGEMTVYKIRLECVCDAQKLNERCARFLPQNEQLWPMFLGRRGDGVLPPRR